MDAPALTFDEAAHVYRLGGAVVPSVTQLLKPIGADFSQIDPRVLEAKRQLGTSVHLACELDDENDLDEETLPADVLPYLQAWRKFKADTGAVVIMNEQRLASVSHRFAGTLDRVVQVRSGDIYLIDLKTAASMWRSFGVQLCGYQLLLDESAFTTKLARKGLQLKADGTYRLEPYNNPNDAACFRALLSLHHWKESQK